MNCVDCGHPAYAHWEARRRDRPWEHGCTENVSGYPGRGACKCQAFVAPPTPRELQLDRIEAKLDALEKRLSRAQIWTAEDSHNVGKDKEIMGAWEADYRERHAKSDTPLASTDYRDTVTQRQTDDQAMDGWRKYVSETGRILPHQPEQRVRP